MIGTGIGILVGLAVWVALQIYYWGRGQNKAPDIKTAWSSYVCGLKSRKGQVVSLTGV